MERPSGDQRAAPAPPRNEVSWEQFDPSLSQVQISEYPERSESNATLLPLGEKCGLEFRHFAEMTGVAGPC